MYYHSTMKIIAFKWTKADIAVAAFLGLFLYVVLAFIWA